jgi:hypothetical protein
MHSQIVQSVLQVIGECVPSALRRAEFGNDAALSGNAADDVVVPAAEQFAALLKIEPGVNLAVRDRFPRQRLSQSPELDRGLDLMGFKMPFGRHHGDRALACSSLPWS